MINTACDNIISAIFGSMISAACVNMTSAACGNISASGGIELAMSMHVLQTCTGKNPTLPTPSGHMGLREEWLKWTDGWIEKSKGGEDQWPGGKWGAYVRYFHPKANLIQLFI